MTELWKSKKHKDWLSAEEQYYSLVKPENIALERELEEISSQSIDNMSTEEFYSFLYHKYFRWKFTAKNRLKTTRKHLIYYENNLQELSLIKQALFSFDKSNTELGLKIAMLIKGLGCAGASGLLSILFPAYFGTVDQFVVKRLCGFSTFKCNSDIQNINPENINLKQAVLLEKILIEKAKTLNMLNNTDYWTPRKIDKVLWVLNR